MTGECLAESRLVLQSKACLCVHCFLTATITSDADGALFPALLPFSDRYRLAVKRSSQALLRGNAALINWRAFGAQRTCFSPPNPRVCSSVACFDEVGKTTESWSHVEGRKVGLSLVHANHQHTVLRLLAVLNKSSWNRFIQTFKQTAM